MFGFSRRRMKLGRLKKVQLSDSAQGIRSPMQHPKRNRNINGEVAPATTSSNTEEVDCKYSSDAPILGNSASSNSENWMVLSIAGDKPTPRFNHAAAVIGNKMVLVGGESGNGLLDDVQVLSFDRFTWTKASSKLYMSPSSLPLKIPGCKGHSLVSWGKKAILVGGKADPAVNRISVWAFDTETECWSLMEAKGDIPAARSGHTVVRASSVLILFGGEDAKKKKLNDLHMFDLKSWTWLPLHCTGTGPSSRSNHVAALYDDKTLLIFGGLSKSRTLNDLYSLDFETMIWSRLKIHGFHPSPRSGCCGVLCGTKWYIAGGGSRKKRHVDTLIFDVLKFEWSVAIASPSSSITTNKGFSLVLVQHKEKDFLVAFGGSKKEPSNQVEVLIVEKNDLSVGRQSTLGKDVGFTLFENCSSASGLDAHLINGPQRPLNSSSRQNLASVIEQQHGSDRKSVSEYSLTHPSSGNVSLRKQYRNGDEYSVATIPKSSEDENAISVSQGMKPRTSQYDIRSQTNITIGKNSANDDTSAVFEYELSNPRNHRDEEVPEDHDDDDLVLAETGQSAASGAHKQYETKIVSLIRKNGILEGQLAAAVASREAAERTLSSVLKNRHEMEKKLADTVKEVELLQEKLAGVEFAQEEANSLSNIVHSDNVRLEHDVAFLKAVLDDTQKDLHSTRGVLAGERARAFQLQVEVFHLKQRLQSMENRAPTPRKPFL